MLYFVVEGDTQQHVINLAAQIPTDEFQDRINTGVVQNSYSALYIEKTSAVILTQGGTTAPAQTTAPSPPAQTPSPPPPAPSAPSPPAAPPSNVVAAPPPPSAQTVDVSFSGAASVIPILFHAAALLFLGSVALDLA